MEPEANWQEELTHLLHLASTDKALLNSLLNDLLTPEELRSVAVRWQIIKQLSQGIPQREIASTLGVSIATVTRGSRMLQQQSGFRDIITMILSMNNPTGLTKAWRNELTE